MVEAPIAEPDSQPVTSGGDPWEDEKWTQYKWTVYRGQAYDLTPYLARHPGGRWLLNLAIGRDCTALFESSHLRPEVATKAFDRLPKLEGFPVDAVPRSPYPNDSELYNAIRCARAAALLPLAAAAAGSSWPRLGRCSNSCAAPPAARRARPAPRPPASPPRPALLAPPPPLPRPPPPRERVRKEIFKGEEAKGAHRSGSEGAALAVLGYTALTYSLYITNTNPITGARFPPPRPAAGALLLAGALEGATTPRCAALGPRAAHGGPTRTRSSPRPQARCWAWPAPGSG
jgi:hypothetical protein